MKKPSTPAQRATRYLSRYQDSYAVMEKAALQMRCQIGFLSSKMSAQEHAHLLRAAQLMAESFVQAWTRLQHEKITRPRYLPLRVA